MRLREIQKIIEENLPRLYNTDFEFISGSGYKAKNYPEIFLAVLNIEKLGFIDEPYNSLIQSNLLVNSSKSESVIFSQDRKKTFVTNINKIIYNLNNS